MINNLLVQIAVVFSGILAIFTFGNFLGRKSQKTKQLEQDYTDAIESKKRQENRRNDDIAAIRKRLRKYVRK